MMEQELRRWLAGKLKKDDVPDWLWDWLRGEYPDALDAALDGGDVDRHELLRIARRILKYAPRSEARRPALGRTVSVRPTPTLSDYEARRELAVSEHVARQATASRRLRRFRTDFLGGRTLTAAQARAFVTSPALAFLTPGQCKQRGIPLVGHTAALEGIGQIPEGHGQRTWVYVRVDPPGGAFWIERRYELPLQDPLLVEHLPIPDTDGRHGIVRIWRHSVLDELRKLAADTAKRYDWTAEIAAWFALTGDVQLVSALQVGTKLRFGTDRSYGRITLSVEPWVPEATVRRVYRDIQRQMLGGHDNRPIGLRNLGLFRFVREHRQDGEPPRWRTLMARWNELHPEPEWRYDNWRRMAGDFDRTERALLFPRYDPPKRENA